MQQMCPLYERWERTSSNKVTFSFLQNKPNFKIKFRKHITIRNYVYSRFYIKGIRNQAVVYADMEKKDDLYEYSYLLAEMESYPREKVFVIDNRVHELGFSTL